MYSRVIIKAVHSLDASPNIKERARTLRKNPTPAEQKLWKYLRNNKVNGLNFRRQHPYGIYILDFFCFKAKLALEVDGPIHLLTREYDKERTDFIELSGVSVLRFTNEDIENRIDWVIQTIIEKTTQPFPLGETGKGVRKEIKEIKKGSDYIIY